MDEIISKSVESLLQITVQNYVTDYIQSNSAFRAQTGKPSKVVRITSGKCCKWCSQIAGTYVVGIDDINNVDGKGHSVFQRHENCDCLVTWHDYRGIKNVHTKETYTRSQYEVQKTKLFSISDTYGRGFAGGVNWTGGRFKTQRNPVTNTPKTKQIFNRSSIDITDETLKACIPYEGDVEYIMQFCQDGRQFYVDGKNVFLTPSENEVEIAKLIQEKIGTKVQMMPKVNGRVFNVKTPDYLINGERFELKTPETFNKNKLDYMLDRRQADNYIFDISHPSVRDREDDLLEQAEKLYQKGMKGYLKTVIIVKDRRIIKILTRK